MDDEGVWSGFMNLGMHAVVCRRAVGAKRSWLETGISVLALFFFTPRYCTCTTACQCQDNFHWAAGTTCFFLPRPTHFA
jgi:hypothetical protein